MLILQLADKPHFKSASKYDELFPADPLTNIRPWHQIEQKIYFPGRALCAYLRQKSHKSIYHVLSRASKKPNSKSSAGINFQSHSRRKRVIVEIEIIKLKSAPSPEHARIYTCDWYSWRSKNHQTQIMFQNERARASNLEWSAIKRASFSDAQGPNLFKLTCRSPSQ